MGAPVIIDEDGFRLRGEQSTRIDAFVDAAFAFALTLLVVGVGHMPSSVPELVQAMRGVPAFAASFFLIARFWLSHRHWSRRYGIEDGYSVRLSLALVFVMLVYVYPLRMVATMMLAMLSGGTLAEQHVGLRDFGDLHALYVIFAIGYGVVVLIFALLYRHALALADALGLSLIERVRTRSAMLRYAALGAIALLSLLLALAPPIGPPTALFYSMPALAYWLIFPVLRFVARRERAALARVEPA